MGGKIAFPIPPVESNESDDEIIAKIKNDYVIKINALPNTRVQAYTPDGKPIAVFNVPNSATTACRHAAVNCVLPLRGRKQNGLCLLIFRLQKTSGEKCAYCVFKV
jgi:hypothetical protein